MLTLISVFKMLGTTEGEIFFMQGQVYLWERLQGMHQNCKHVCLIISKGGKLLRLRRSHQGPIQCRIKKMEPSYCHICNFCCQTETILNIDKKIIILLETKWLNKSIFLISNTAVWNITQIHSQRYSYSACMSIKKISRTQEGVRSTYW